MRFLIEILIKHHVFIIFIFLSFFCLALILKINPYNEANALNIFRSIIYNSKSFENKVTQYINLKNVNSNLEQANCKSPDPSAHRPQIDFSGLKYHVVLSIFLANPLF